MAGDASPVRAAGEGEAEAFPPSPATTAGAVIVVRLGDAEFGLPVERVREVLRSPPVTPVPFTPAPLVGVVNLRGGILPVVDLGLRLLDHPAAPPGRLVVVTAPTGEPVGLRVDAVGGLAEFAVESLAAPPPEAAVSLPAGMIAGVLAPAANRLVAVLDLDAVLALPFPDDHKEAR